MWLRPTNQSTLDAIAFVTSIIQLVYPTKRCVHYFGERSAVIDRVFMQIGMPIVTHAHLCIPSGYLLVEDERFESTYRQHPYYNHNNLRLLIVNQRVDAAFECQRYKSFDRVNGLHVFLLAIRMAADEDEQILAVHLYEIRTCALMDARAAQRFGARARVWRPADDQVIRVSAMQIMPFVRCADGELVDGLEARLLKMAMPDAPLRVTCYDTNRWSDMENDVAGNVSDVGLGGSWDVKVVDLHVDLSRQLIQTCASFLVPKPDLLPIETFAFQAFAVDAWALTALLVVVVAATYKRLERRGALVTHAVALFETYRALFSVPAPRTRRLSTGVLHLAWLMTGLLITTAISAGFTMILIRPRFATPIRTFADILARDLRCFEDESYVADIFAHSNDTRLRRIASRIVFGGRDRIPKDKRCFFADVLSHKYVIPTVDLEQSVKDDLMLLPDCFGTYSIVSVFKRGTPFKRLLDITINQAREHGLIDGWMRHFRMLKTKLMQEFDSYTSMYSSAPDGESSPLLMEEMQGVFYALAVGYALALAAFVWEVRSVSRKVSEP